jgi:hypothetical protein
MHPSFGMTESLLSWPASGFSVIADEIRNYDALVYGGGHEDDESYVINKRLLGSTNTNQSTVESFLAVPRRYGPHLENLCYQINYNRLAWQFMLKHYRGQDGGWHGDYIGVAEFVAKTFKYHIDALMLVQLEVQKSSSEGMLPIRIKTLEEWIIRHKFMLESDDIEMLENARRNGLFDKDIIIDSRHFGKFVIPL